MMRRVLALLVVLSWITLSGVDALEDLDFDSHTTRDFGTAVGWPTSTKPVQLANNILELANRNAFPSRIIAKHIDFRTTADATLLDAYLMPKAFTSQNDCCILLI
jgi:hypothetical protein